MGYFRLPDGFAKSLKWELARAHANARAAWRAVRTFKFRYLRTKLTFLYAGLFGGVLLALALTLYLVVSANAASAVRRELSSNGAVFDRLWEMRTNQLRESAGILSRDFGFRDALSTHDDATIASALENLRRRVNVDRAFMVDTYGDIVGVGIDISDNASADLWRTLDSDAANSGVLMIGGAPYHAIATPIRAPDVVGWIVFATKLDRTAMSSFEDLAAIRLQAGVFQRTPNGTWSSADTQLSKQDTEALSHFLSRSTDWRQSAPKKLSLASGDSIALVRPLKSMTGDEAPAVLLLRYPLQAAMAPYWLLLFLMATIAFGALGVIMYGAWMLSRDLTRPLTALDQAARRLSLGEDAYVPVQSTDEIGRLAENFNAMAATIREREQRISHMANHDLETDLPNRRAIEAWIANRIADPEAGPFGVVAVSIDRFKEIRSAIGYALSANAMRALGQRLSESQAGRPVARLSNDVLITVIDGEDAVALMRNASAIVSPMEAPIRLEASTIDVSVTVGLAVGVEGVPPSALINRANIAIDEARKSHRKVTMFDKESYGDPGKNLSLISEMFDGIKSGDVTLHYQPKYDVGAGRVTAAEALTRWRHPTRGMIPPDLFIGMTEETGHIRGLTDWALRQAIEDQVRLRARGFDIMLSVNISGRLLSDEEFAESALAMIKAANANICFEITETAVVDDPQLALQLIDRYANAGISVSIDDYGSGLSSLAYLKKIRADELKIDKAFIMTATESQRDALLVKSTIDLAHGLGMKVTAEGVETSAAFALLSVMGCDRMQGYLIGKPAPLDTLVDVLSGNAPQKFASAPAPRARAAKSY
jgi:diguanylate cyclase (GGDEF)-like protein